MTDPLQPWEDSFRARASEWEPVAAELRGRGIPARIEPAAAGTARIEVPRRLDPNDVVMLGSAGDDAFDSICLAPMAGTRLVTAGRLVGESEGSAWQAVPVADTAVAALADAMEAAWRATRDAPMLP